jgi:hypothetical protein
VDSNFQYAGTGASRHPLLCCPIAWDELARARVLLGSYDLTREEIWVNLIDRHHVAGGQLAEHPVKLAPVGARARHPLLWSG